MGYNLRLDFPFQNLATENNFKKKKINISFSKWFKINNAKISQSYNAQHKMGIARNPLLWYIRLKGNKVHVLKERLTGLPKRCGSLTVRSTNLGQHECT
ncbi:hypothetical protein POVWA2_040600 [Plasmodium ovale wallikeri]|uniref:Uncharacterized protein n=1 Tax=Plasmodium ovale wallikeri TaxID=864142 RepID=A0A1A8ZAG7_PLAOA|nr:hypothetical protein POVWA1_042090 [Plasmodium ovale wallikeri]SBT40864.1 hypothetical protein POVWA2_040600 [Plasmodium ovale wallikeri]